jgi:phosphatidylglycerol---prolipoprotein diacylglyceryl transferase
MDPELFRIPGLGIPIHSYGLLIVIGFLLSTFLANLESRRRGLPDFVYDLGFVVLLSGILGARLWYFIQFYEKEYEGRSLFAFFEIWKGGLVFYGGGIGGLLGSLLYLRWRKLPLADCLDAVSPFVPIGMAFGRLGCFMNGCCFGKYCGDRFPFGLIFPKINNPNADPPLSPVFQSQVANGMILQSDPAPLPVYPTQLMEAGYDFLMCGFLYWYARKGAPRYANSTLLFIMYGFGRFSVEFLRGDHTRYYYGLTISQIFSIFFVLTFGLIFISLITNNLKRKKQAVENS